MMENNKSTNSIGICEIEDDALDQCLLNLCDGLTNLQKHVSDNSKKSYSFVEEKRKVEEELEALWQKYGALESDHIELKESLKKALDKVTKVIPSIKNAAKGYQTMREIIIALKGELDRALCNRKISEDNEEALFEEKCVMRVEIESLGTKLSNKETEVDELKKVVKSLEEGISRLNKEKDYYVKRNGELLISIKTQKTGPLKQMENRVNYLQTILSSALKTIPQFKSEIEKMMGKDPQPFSRRNEDNFGDPISFLKTVPQLKSGSENATIRDPRLFLEERDQRSSSDKKDTRSSPEKKDPQSSSESKYPQSSSESKYPQSSSGRKYCQSSLESTDEKSFLERNNTPLLRGSATASAYSASKAIVANENQNERCNAARRMAYLANSDSGSNYPQDTESSDGYYSGKKYRQIMTAVDEQLLVVEQMESLLTKHQQTTCSLKEACSWQKPDNDR